MTSDTEPDPHRSESSTQRVTSALCYLAPSWLRALVPARTTTLRAHHRMQATGLAFLLHVLVLAYVVAFLALSATMVFWRSIYDEAAAAVEWTFGALLLLWLLALLAGCVLALAGSTRALPVATALGRRPWLRRLTVTLSAAAHVVVAAAALVAVHSTRLARESDGRPAEVTVLYDDMGFVPRWVITLGSYRLAGAAVERWGGECVVVDRISTEALREAFSTSTLVYLATHGTYEGGGVAYGSTQLVPADIGTSIMPGAGLRFVCLTACDGGVGDAGRAWEQAFAPARVVSFDRLSANVEHAWWLWVESPGVVAGLE